VLARPDEYLVAARSRGRPVGLDMRNSVATQPIGVIISGADFKTEAAANFAGEKALVEFLDRLATRMKCLSPYRIRRRLWPRRLIKANQGGP
jgi:hypothetical protein